MKKLLLQLDSSRLPSVFDAVVAYDGGADEVMSRGGVAEEDVRDLVHGCIFTRGPKDLKNTALFIGGTDMGKGEKLLAAAEKAVFNGFRISMMLDSNGSNTTAVAAVEKISRAVDGVKGKKVLVTAGTGPVGMRAAGLFSKAGANVTITSRKPEEGERIRKAIAERFGGEINAVVMHDKSEAGRIIDEVKPQILLNTGPAGVMLVPRDAWMGEENLLVACDLNAVPPLGIEGIEVTDNGEKRNGTTTFGALGVGGFKMKVHKRCIARLFESNDAVLDAEAIAEVAEGIE
ncbi:MAG TPA: NADP-dependent methylenetetrahydromethanopterin/methylenetetrahydrofolate dehydrogenase [Gemmatimonadaceae bacterium]|nr:NADP-dependent methylenetetrahydromethanopterin/methylenetetrahydrofolate dehydrogenase [Gemmatimonadaceae bacterium]